MAGLTGFIIGSLNKVWPWKEVLDKEIDAHGKEIIFVGKERFAFGFRWRTSGFIGCGASFCGVYFDFMELKNGHQKCKMINQ